MPNIGLRSGLLINKLIIIKLNINGRRIFLLDSVKIQVRGTTIDDGENGFFVLPCTTEKQNPNSQNEFTAFYIAMHYRGLFSFRDTIGTTGDVEGRREIPIGMRYAPFDYFEIHLA